MHLSGSLERSNVDASAVGIRYAVSDVLLNRSLSLLGITLFFGWIAGMFLDCVRKVRYKDGPGHEAVRNTWRCIRARRAD